MTSNLAGPLSQDDRHPTSRRLPPVAQFGHAEIEREQMHVLWGCLTAAAGLFMLVCGLLKSEFVVYRLMIARSKILWGENVHRFYQIVGVIVMVFGALVALGFVGKQL